MSSIGLHLYQQHFVDKQGERLGLFLLLAEYYAVRSALYPGSFVHLTPAFVFPSTCFVDMDRRAVRFFDDPAVLDLVRKRKSYEEQPAVRFYHTAYARGFAEADGTDNLLISDFSPSKAKTYGKPCG